MKASQLRIHSALATRLAQLLAQRGARVTTAESCTGGGIAQALTSVAGCSEWFDCGWVTYSNGAKSQMLGVAPELLELCGAVSREVVEAMAMGAQMRAGADFAIAVSGIAGPGGGSPDKPVGTVWVAWCWPDRRCTSQCLHLNGDRAEVRAQTVTTALQGLIRGLQEPVGDR